MRFRNWKSGFLPNLCNQYILCERHIDVKKRWKADCFLVPVTSTSCVKCKRYKDGIKNDPKVKQSYTHVLQKRDKEGQSQIIINVNKHRELKMSIIDPINNREGGMQALRTSGLLAVLAFSVKVDSLVN